VSGIPMSKDPGIVSNGATFTTFSLTASAPLGTGAQSQTLFANGGLGKSNSIGISAYHFMTDWRNPSAQDRADYKTLCDGMRKNAETSKGVKNEDALKLECKKGNFLLYAPEDLPKAESLRPGPLSGGWGVALNGKVGQSDAVYYDAATLTKKTTQNKPWSLGIVASYIFPTNEQLVAIGWDRRKTYKDKESATRCPQPATAPGPVECVTGSFDKPSEKSSNVITLEGRALFAGDMGMSISVARDLTKKVTSVEVPIYLMTNVTGALTGGLKVNWDSDTKKTVFGVFVGVPFNVWR